ncbi:MAG: hypothetical protein HY579_02660 [Nitrospinae bacterium]|nr:hypothetical protein [Nitrospinota bacterium]
MTCPTCHVPSFPKLNDFGNLFRDRGYQMGTENELPTHESITMGYWPVSLRTTTGYQGSSLRVDGNQMTSSGFGFTGMDILSFGILTRNVSFGIVFTPGLSGAGFQTGSSVNDGNLEAAYVRLDNLERFIGGGDKSYLLNLKVGRFELDSPFSEKRNSTLNTTFAMYHYQAGTPYTVHQAAANATATYANPNSFIFGDNQNGLELSGFAEVPGTKKGYFRYSLTAVSNNTMGGTLQNGAGTGGNDMSFYGRVSQSFGGYGIVKGHRVGVFGASGSAPTSASSLCPDCLAVGTDARNFDRVGVDFSTTFASEWNLFGAWMHANDDKELFAPAIATAQRATWNGAFAELDWSPAQFPVLNLPGMMLIYRYDMIRNETQGNSTFVKDYNDVNSHTFMVRYNFHYSPRTDIALHAEYNVSDVAKVGLLGGDQLEKTFLLGFDFAF